MKKLKFKTVFLGATLLLLISCEKQTDNQVIISEKIPQSDRELIFKLNFDTTNIKDIGEYYVVDGDILLKKDILSSYLTPKDTSRLKQARRESLVSMTNVHNITIWVDASIPTAGEDNWRGAIQEAINEWNNTSSHVHMSLASNSIADIIIKDDEGTLFDGDFNSFALASAAWPSGSKPGSSILINLNAGDNRIFSDLQKKFNMVHELGHTIGLRHTNWALWGESTPIGIIGTPNSGLDPDPNSIMNGGTALNAWNSFSNFDLVAIRNLYPFQPMQITGELDLTTFIKPGLSYIYRLSFGSYPPSSCTWKVNNGGIQTLIPATGTTASVYTKYASYLKNGVNETSYIEVLCNETQLSTWITVQVKDGYLLSPSSGQLEE